MRAGGDPAQQARDAIDAKKAELDGCEDRQHTKPLTFKRVVREYVDEFGKDKWRSARAAKAFVTNLDNHVMALIGNMLVIDIGHDHVLAVFDKLYTHSPIMASRIRGVCESVMGYRDYAPSARGVEPLRVERLAGVHLQEEASIEKLCGHRLQDNAGAVRAVDRDG